MKRVVCLWLSAIVALCAQTNLSPAEQASLTRALGEAGNSPVDFMRAIEIHLKQYPNSPKRAELERALVKTAIQQNDDARVIEFGENALSQEPDDVQAQGRGTAEVRAVPPASVRQAAQVRHASQRAPAHSPAPSERRRRA